MHRYREDPGDQQHEPQRQQSDRESAAFPGWDLSQTAHVAVNRSAPRSLALAAMLTHVASIRHRARSAPTGSLAAVRIARFVHPGGIAWGVVEGQPDAAFEALTLATIKDHPMGPIEFTGERFAIGDVRLLAPILPSKVLAVGRNYAAHAAELGNDVPERPLIFLKPSTSVIGTHDVIRLPADSDQVEHEAELALIVGKVAKDVSPENAAEVIFGYTCANDVTARDQQRADGQFTRAKGYDSFCPIGPWIETTFDPGAARVRALVNGEVKQDGNTKDMVFDIATLVSFMSHVMTLVPGDVILTGTPDGVSRIVDGDTVTVSIEGIGELTNPVRAK
jgi:2-keto-4-pentenoate hydratase/2-oxohepta-3-ene-1,7-dioic acid hydratase in catechol pathway